MPRRRKGEEIRAEHVSVGDTLLTAVGPSVVKRIEEAHHGLEFLVAMGSAERVLWYWPQNLVKRTPVKAR